MQKKKRYITIQIIPDDSTESWVLKLRYRFFEFLFYSIVIALFAVAFAALKLGEINSKVLLANHLAQKNQLLLEKQRKIILLEQEVSRIYEQESRIRGLLQTFIKPEKSDDQRIAAHQAHNANYLVNFVLKAKAIRLAKFKDKFLGSDLTPDIWPVSGIIDQKLIAGKKQNQKSGIDILTESNALVVSTAQGLVLQSDRDRDLGRYVKIEHAPGTITIYAHLSRAYVQMGDHVNKGSAIGTVGNTGNNIGPHMHYEIFIQGQSVDPLNFLK